MATKLKVYKGDKHPHFAQQPQPLEFHASNAAKTPGTPKPGQPTHNATAHHAALEG
jgi:large subunit ribosomal protein L13